MRALVAVLLMLVGGGPTTTPGSGLGSRITTGIFDGVIVTAQGVESWTPTAAQVAELEKALPAYVVSRRHDRGTLSRGLFEYKRQYMGWVDQGRRVIIIHFFHRSTQLVKSGQWRVGAFTVDGGGEDYLEARYDATNHKFIDFSINGPL